MVCNIRSNLIIHITTYLTEKTIFHPEINVPAPLEDFNQQIPISPRKEFYVGVSNERRKGGEEFQYMRATAGRRN